MSSVFYSSSRPASTLGAMRPLGTDADLETAKLWCGERGEQMALLKVQVGAHPQRALWELSAQQEKDFEMMGFPVEVEREEKGLEQLLGDWRQT